MNTIYDRRWSTIKLTVLLTLWFASVPARAQAPWPEEPNDVILDFPEPPDFGSVGEPYDSLPWEPVRPPQTNQRLVNQRLGLLTASERAPFRFITSFVPSESVQDSSDTLSSHSIAAQLAFPLQIYPNGILLGTTSLKYTRLSTDAVLPQSGTEIPGELWDVRAGMFINRELNNGWSVGGLFNVGSASDEPFASFHELTLTSLAFVSVPARNRDSWNFSFFYSPTSQIRFPIPGIAYAWRPNDQLEAQLGLPASLTYAPNDSFSFRARYTPVTDVFVEARQALSSDWTLFARYQIINETYFLADRDDREDRFFQFEQQLATGITRQLPNGFSLDLSAGYLFDRRFFQSPDFELSSDDMIEVDAGMAYTLQVIWMR